MLEQLQIRNLATIESLSLDLLPGLTVLSGETGAGKSILIDALGLVLGTRADPALIRSGASSADITALFAVAPDSAAADWLREQALLDESEPQQCLIRRVLQVEGRTRAFVNGTAVAAGKLRELGERLVDVFGQNESHSLRLGDVQRSLLDGYGQHAGLLQPVAAAALEWVQLQQRIEHMRQAAARDPAELDLLRHQVQELDSLRLRKDEFDDIEAEHRRLANAGRLLQDGALAQDALYGADGAIHDQLAAALQRLRALVPLHEGFAEAEALVESAQAQVREAADALRRLLGRLDLDPLRLQELDARLSDIHELARKHRVRADELPACLLALRQELQDAEAAGGQVDRLLQQQAAVLAQYQAAAAALGKARRRHAKDHAAAVTARVRELGMPNARFEVRVDTIAGARPSRHGDDEVSFDFSANPGQAPRPLAKVASGGELSRVSLALQAVAQEVDGAPTMIFDEVDAGIGGGVAEAVGRQLRLLGAQRQVLCVTHLGQVAACGLQHLAVRKTVREQQTYTSVETLTGKSRVAELARMIGGHSSSGATETVARELLRTAAEN
ncbi:DNA repair protein RecN [Panacagrimonas sp.]|uniref:DNA repair protein RecN n=1 Tax=Panacagrimonas sp. TaxID=2480088 RepID=UPI003B520878